MNENTTRALAFVAIAAMVASCLHNCIGCRRAEMMQSHMERMESMRRECPRKVQP